MADRAQQEFKQRRARARGRSRRAWGQGAAQGAASGTAPPFAGEPNAQVNIGWGRLIFADSFATVEDLTEAMRREAPDERDITINVANPHVLLAQAPEAFFLDPSHTYRLEFERYRARTDRVAGVYIRRLRSSGDAEAVNRIYAKVGMVPVGRDFLLVHRGSRRIVHLVAVDETTDEVVGTITGVDHEKVYEDPDRGSSLWGLAVDPQAPLPGIGEVLLRHLIETFQTRGLGHIDLSVMHDNAPAIALYEKIGFQRIPLFNLKYKNPINEKLYSAPMPEEKLNPYARILINEARRRGITVDVEDSVAGLFALSHGGRRVACRESLSELTSAVALSRCDDKALTHRLLARHGLRVPEQQEVDDPQEARAFLDRIGRVVVKPAKGEQGRGISVDIADAEAMERAVELARGVSDRVLLEQFCEGQDLRIIVIGFKVIAAAVRLPATVIGDGVNDVRSLIDRHSRRRASATGGESRIPRDAETERCVEAAGYTMDSILDKGRSLAVRKTANLHTGGTIHDVTDQLHPHLRSVAEQGARVLDIPVVGFDFLVPDVAGDDYVIIEANERPGLANHEPQPTAEAFVDLLFPHTADRVQEMKEVRHARG